MTPLILPENVYSVAQLKSAVITAATATLLNNAINAWFNNVNNKYFGAIQRPEISYDGTNMQAFITYIDYTPVDRPITRLINNSTLSAPASYSSVAAS